MAFSATVRGQSYQGQLRIVYGDWSGVVGDSAGTLSVGGRYMGSLWFKNDPSGTNPTTQFFPVVSWDGNVPGNLTVNNTDNVGVGSFLIFSLGA